MLLNLLYINGWVYAMLGCVCVVVSCCGLCLCMGGVPVPLDSVVVSIMVVLVVWPVGTFGFSYWLVLSLVQVGSLVFVCCMYYMFFWLGLHSGLLHSGLGVCVLGCSLLCLLFSCCLL